MPSSTRPLRARLLAILLIAGAAAPAAAVIFPSGATRDGALFPAVVIDKATLAYTADGMGNISQCTAIVSTKSVRRDYRACDTLRNRGVPRDIKPALPVADAQPLVTPADYPERAVRRGDSGTTRAVVEVDETGKAAACWVFLSSGSADLDQRSCTLILARARYMPATLKGQPVRAIGMRDVAWEAPPKR
ncbi:energy transducer TonB [Edaphosphingomonas haloaromaticamans]|uniref:Gram-negative bacterial tonB protein n=1 Tax=Edaphosphingomonas haloaromaticamans TaxID=653954 RepID=A0A1S1H884_9SPHN|nr:energy transducer TonB [Sphingomonas haloaromaticamans]OHT18399.1 Gram-negative bacterial tonB protein [Sphingomonas haloaromaticamans]